MAERRIRYSARLTTKTGSLADRILEITEMDVTNESKFNFGDLVTTKGQLKAWAIGESKTLSKDSIDGILAADNGSGSICYRYRVRLSYYDEEKLVAIRDAKAEAIRLLAQRIEIISMADVEA